MKIIHEVDHERKSTNPTDIEKYKHGVFIHAIVHVVSKLDLDKESPSTQSFESDYSRTDSSQQNCYNCHHSLRSLNMLNDVYCTDRKIMMDYCLYNVDVDYIPDHHYNMLCAAVDEIARNMNQFDKTIYPCIIYGEKGHAFDTCPELKCTDFSEAYMKLNVAANQFCYLLNELDKDGSKHNHNLKHCQRLHL